MGRERGAGDSPSPPGQACGGGCGSRAVPQAKAAPAPGHGIGTCHPSPAAGVHRGGQLGILVSSPGQRDEGSPTVWGLQHSSAAPGLSALPCGAGLRGTGVGDDSDLLPAPGQPIRVSCPMLFHCGNVARATDASEGQQKAPQSREHQRSTRVKSRGSFRRDPLQSGQVMGHGWGRHPQRCLMLETPPEPGKVQPGGPAGSQPGVRALFQRSREQASPMDAASSGHCR